MYEYNNYLNYDFLRYAVKTKLYGTLRAFSDPNSTKVVKTVFLFIKKE